MGLGDKNKTSSRFDTETMVTILGLVFISFIAYTCSENGYISIVGAIIFIVMSGLSLGCYLRREGYARGYRQGVKDTEIKLSKGDK